MTVLQKKEEKKRRYPQLHIIFKVMLYMGHSKCYFKAYHWWNSLTEW